MGFKRFKSVPVPPACHNKTPHLAGFCRLRCGAVRRRASQPSPESECNAPMPRHQSALGCPPRSIPIGIHVHEGSHAANPADLAGPNPSHNHRRQDLVFVGYHCAEFEFPRSLSGELRSAEAEDATCRQGVDPMVGGERWACPCAGAGMMICCDSTKRGNAMADTVMKAPVLDVVLASGIDAALGTVSVTFGSIDTKRFQLDFSAQCVPLAIAALSVEMGKLVATLPAEMTQNCRAFL